MVKTYSETTKSISQLKLESIILALLLLHLLHPLLFLTSLFLVEYSVLLLGKYVLFDFKILNLSVQVGFLDIDVSDVDNLNGL